MVKICMRKFYLHSAQFLVENGGKIYAQFFRLTDTEQVMNYNES